MKAVYALYNDPSSAQRGVERLRAAGYKDADIVIISSEPFEEWEFSHFHKETYLYWIAGCGGVVGFLAAYALVAGTQSLWPINTGGMPIVPWWTNLIPIFEMTMLGAILATVISLLVTTKLPRRQPKLYDQAVADGKILVGIENPAESSVAALEQALITSGVGRLHTIA